MAVVAEKSVCADAREGTGVGVTASAHGRAREGTRGCGCVTRERQPVHAKQAVHVCGHVSGRADT
jgi:hypothetical protein